MKKNTASRKRGGSFLSRLQSNSLPAYIALRRQKVKLGPLKTADADLELFLFTPDEVMVEK